MTDDEADEAIWKMFLMDRPDLAGHRHDDPDPENKVWPAFVEWRDEMRKWAQEADELLPVTKRLLRGGVE
jgi:hypothetical protein